MNLSIKSFKMFENDPVYYKYGGEVIKMLKIMG